VLTSLWLFLFAAQPKEFFLDGLKKLEQPSHKCVELRGEYVEQIFSIPKLVFFIKPKTYQPPSYTDMFTSQMNPIHIFTLY
jgi:hypothetical protein